MAISVLTEPAFFDGALEHLRAVRARVQTPLLRKDFIVEESMGPILDRTQEWLGTSDAVIARARRMLLKALDEHAQGKLPFGLDEKVDYSQVRALAIRFPKGTDWKAIDVKNPPSFK